MLQDRRRTMVHQRANVGASSDTFIVPRNSDLDHSVRSTYPSAAYISDQPR
jgi:hypothetical protein